MSKIKRTIVQFLYDIEDSILNIQKQVKPLSFEEFMENEVVIVFFFVEGKTFSLGFVLSEVWDVSVDVFFM